MLRRRASSGQMTGATWGRSHEEIIQWFDSAWSLLLQEGFSSHPGDEMGHRNSEADPAEKDHREGGRQNERKDPEMGQWEPRQGFTGGDDQGAYGVPGRQPPGQPGAFRGIDNRGEEHPERGDDG